MRKKCVFLDTVKVVLHLKTDTVKLPKLQGYSRQKTPSKTPYISASRKVENFLKIAFYSYEKSFLGSFFFKSSKPHKD